jgi:predicted ATPase/class 3 adenylate cyclase
MDARPTGTITFLFTDIEGSTRLLQELGDRYPDALEDHRRLLREAFERDGGHEVDTQGDAFFIAFARTQDAANAAAEAQRSLAGHDWPGGRQLRVRMGIHTCEATPTEHGYVGIGVHRGARIAAAGHGGQILLSETTRNLLEEHSSELAVRDLGEHRLKDLSQPQHLYQLVGEGLAADFPPLKTLENRPTNLPPQPTPLVGRAQELREICELVCGEGRIVTLTGPGGAGKTRLALQAGAELLERFPDGAFFIPLAALTDPDLVLPTVAQTLGVTSAGIQTLESYLAEKELLLVLDNLEQVLDAAPQIAELCSQGARLKVLSTSREPLRLSGERVYPVPPLELEQEAVELFAERARAAKPDFELDGNTPVVRELCARLDGLPLALELAAARIATLTPEAMLERLGDRLRLLSGGARDVPERQRTIRDTIEWSYELLSNEERSLFARLGPFAGGFTLEAAEAVCDAELDALTSLVAKSLVQHTDGPYSMLETIRAYALERLGDARDEVAERHASYFLVLAEQGWTERFEREAYWRARLEPELDNLRAALDWLTERDSERELRLAAYLGFLWSRLSHFREGRSRLEAALGRSTKDPRARALALVWAGQCAAWLGDTETGIERTKESLALWRSLGDRDEVAMTLNMLAAAQFLRGDNAAARAAAEESLSLTRTIGHEHGVVSCISMLTQILVAEGDIQSAEPLAREALAASRELGSVRIEHFAHHYLGDCSLIGGDAESALPHYRRSLETAVEIGDRVEVFTELQGVAMSLAGIGRADVALRLGGAAEEGFESLGVDLSGITFWMELLERYLGPARAQLGEDDWNAGRQLDEDQAVALAMAPA